SCGAKLPEDARFCHKCGKPQRDEPLLREEQPPPPPPPAAQPQAAPLPPPISLGNPFVLRAALPAAIAAFFSLPLGPLVLITWIASGFFAVYLYRMRTGAQLNAVNGAHLGWISGVFLFLFALVASTIIALTMSPATLDQMREQWIKANPGGEAQFTQVLAV